MSWKSLSRAVQWSRGYHLRETGKESRHSEQPTGRHCVRTWSVHLGPGPLLLFIQSMLGGVGTAAPVRKAELPANLSATSLPHYSLLHTPCAQRRLIVVQRPSAKRTNGVRVQNQSFHFRESNAVRLRMKAWWLLAESGMHQMVRLQDSGRHSLGEKGILHSLG